MSRSAVLIVAAVGALALAGCGSDDVRYHDLPPGRLGQGGGGDPAGRRVDILNLFIAPSGKPYRAAPGAPYPVATWFAAADLDHDGKLTLAEFRQDAEAFFRELDADHDGVIDGFEAQAYEQKVAPEILPRVEGLVAGEGMDLSLGHGGGRRSDAPPDIGSSRTARGGGRPRAGDQRPEGAGVFGLLNEPQPVAACDSNFDGKITLAEFLAAADRRFAALDSKNQGYLTLADLPKTPAQQAAERAAQRRAKAGERGAGPPPPRP